MVSSKRPRLARHNLNSSVAVLEISGCDREVNQKSLSAVFQDATIDALAPVGHGAGCEALLDTATTGASIELRNPF